jgi:3-deoxy-D-manno-octulosonic-acid transferase
LNRQLGKESRVACLISWLLNVVYLAIIAVASPLIVWQSWRTGKYREGFRQKLLGWVPRRDGNTTCVWVHAVSVGEVNLVGVLLRELRTAHPDWQFVVSTTSRTGYELARKKYADLSVFYCPLDFSWAVSRAMRRIRPTILVLAELELWPNLIRAAKDHGARVAIVNGRMSDHSFPGYRRIRPFVAAVLRQIDLIAAQNDESAMRFRALGAPVDRVVVTGSLKYDGAQTNRNNCRTQSLRQLAGIIEGDIIFLAGSTQEPEEQYALDAFRRLAPQHPRLRLVLVPRHPERFDAVAKLLGASGIAWSRRSALTSQPSAPPGATSRVLLVDTIGELGAWWGTAQLAFVGGSFGDRGGQNMIEPAAYGAAVSYGPNTRNFRDIVAALEAAAAAVTVHTADELEAFVARCLTDPPHAATLGAHAQNLVRSQLGATARTIALIDSLVPPASSQASARSAA